MRERFNFSRRNPKRRLPLRSAGALHIYSECAASLPKKTKRVLANQHAPVERVSESRLRVYYKAI